MTTKNKSSPSRARERSRVETHARARAVPLSEKYAHRDEVNEELAIYVHDDDYEDIVVNHKNRSTTYMSIKGFVRELEIPKKLVQDICKDLKVARTFKVKGEVKNLFRLREFFAAFFEREDAKRKQAGPGRPKKERTLSKDEEDLRLTRARADKAEVELAEKLGAVHLEEDIIKEVGDMLGSFRARVMSVPTKAAAIVPPEQRPEVEAAIKKIINEALAEIATYRPQRTRRVEKEVNGHKEESRAE